MPLDPETQTTLGFAFIEFQSPEVCMAHMRNSMLPCTRHAPHVDT